MLLDPEGPAAELVSSAAHVFVDDLEAPGLTEADTHHLARTLRLRNGEVVTASDGAGRWRRCTWQGTEGPLEPDGPVMVSESPLPRITVGFAVTKGDRPEVVVRGLTEVGVDRIVPMVTARSVVRWEPERAAHHLERLRRVARGAAMQSRRIWLPEVATLTGVAELAAALRVGGASAMAQVGGGPLPAGLSGILIGPEGGWDAFELGAGLPLVGLGPTVLRAETAALAVGVLLCASRASVIRPE